MRAIKFEVTEGALKSIERFKSEIKEEGGSEIHVGISCKNPGCEKVFLTNSLRCGYFLLLFFL